MRHVFVSFSSRDSKVARSICNAIEERGHKCWISSRDVEPGRNYQDAIVEAIGNASAFLLVFSQNSNNSAEIKKEISLASSNNLFVVPVRIEDVVPTGALKYELSTRQWIDIFDDWERAIGRIGDQIRSIGTPGSESPPPPRSKGLRWLRRRLRRSSYLVAGAATALLVVSCVLWWSLTPVAALNFPAVDPESLDARVNEFTLTVIVGVDERKRHWERVTADRWVETYLENDARVQHNIVKRMLLADCPGTVVEEVGAYRKFAFIPDKGCPGMPFRLSQASDGWGVAGYLDDVR